MTILLIALIGLAQANAKPAENAKASEAEKGGEMTLAIAKSAVHKAQACAKKKKFKFTYAVVDASGTLVYLERDDEAWEGSVDSAIAKARTANNWQKPTKVWADALAKGDYALLTDKNLIPIDGGNPIVSNGKHIGAFGIAGSKKEGDEECANAAVAAE